MYLNIYFFQPLSSHLTILCISYYSCLPVCLLSRQQHQIYSIIRRKAAALRGSAKDRNRTQRMPKQTRQIPTHSTTPPSTADVCRSSRGTLRIAFQCFLFSLFPPQRTSSPLLRLLVSGGRRSPEFPLNFLFLCDPRVRRDVARQWLRFYRSPREKISFFFLFLLASFWPLIDATTET